MANALKGEFTVTVAPAEEGGAPETLTLVYDWDALCALEDYMDKGLIDLLVLMSRGYRLKLTRGLFWAGLRAKHPGVSLVASDDLILRAGGPIELFGKLCDGFQKAFPSAKEQDDAHPPKPAATPALDGTPSTASASGSSTD